MDGDIGPLPGLVAAAEKHGAIMMVDDAHSSGVLGRNGRGTIDHFGLHGRVHIQVGTLSKAIGVLGGYVCGSRDLIEFLYHRARPFLFSTSHPPAVAAACLAAFDVLEQEPERIDALWANARYFKQGLTAAGFDTGISETPITPVMVGEAALAHRFSRELFAGRRAGHRHRFPHRSQGQSARADDRGLHPHSGGVGPRARNLHQGRQAPGNSVGQTIAFRGLSRLDRCAALTGSKNRSGAPGIPADHRRQDRRRYRFRGPAARPPALPISRAGGPSQQTDDKRRSPTPSGIARRGRPGFRWNP